MTARTPLQNPSTSTSTSTSTPTPSHRVAAGARLGPLVAVLLLAGWVLGCSSPPADAPPAATLENAREHLRAGDSAAAENLLAEITRREPDNPQAWDLLGVALSSQEKWEAALAAFERGREIDPAAPRVTYHTARELARLGRADEAFELLFALREAGTFNLTEVPLDAGFESLREDPRFSALPPAPEAFADPFVEDVRVIHEWVGEAQNDAFGWIARNLGDVDGDGVADVVTSAPSKRIGEGTGDGDAGEIYVFSGRTGELLWRRAGSPGDQLGQGVEAAGDTDCDGVPDVIAGAPGGGWAGVWSGRDGRELLRLAATREGESFGRHTEGVGDLDGDGCSDLLVGAPEADGAADTGPLEDAGRAYLYSGKSGRLLRTFDGERAGDGLGAAVAGGGDGERTFVLLGAPGAGRGQRGRVYVYTDLHRDLTAGAAWVIDAEDTGVRLGGMFLSVVGDVDADGVPDVYASDWYDAALGPVTGRIYVHSGADGRRLRTLTGEAAGDGFGIGPADAGDLDGDGHDDLVVGAWQHAGAAPAGGKVYVFSGKDGSLLRAITCKVPGDTFGFDATGMGDVDGDGVPDLLLTSAWSAVRGAHSGRMFLVSGQRGG